MKDSLKIGCGIVLGILVILALCIGGLMVIGVLAPEPEEVLEEVEKELFATPTEALAPREKALPLGEWATVAGVTVSVADYEFASSYEKEYYPYQVAPEEGAKFLWIHVSAENVGDVEKGLPHAYFFELLYKGSETYGFAPALVKGRKTYDAESVYPGVSREGWILYELPIAAEADEIVVRLQWYGGPGHESEYSFWRLGP